MLCAPLPSDEKKAISCVLGKFVVTSVGGHVPCGADVGACRRVDRGVRSTPVYAIIPPLMRPLGLRPNGKLVVAGAASLASANFQKVAIPTAVSWLCSGDQVPSAGVGVVTPVPPWTVTMAIMKSPTARPVGFGIFRLVLLTCESELSVAPRSPTAALGRQRRQQQYGDHRRESGDAAGERASCGAAS